MEITRVRQSRVVHRRDRLTPNHQQAQDQTREAASVRAAWPAGACAGVWTGHWDVTTALHAAVRSEGATPGQRPGGLRKEQRTLCRPNAAPAPSHSGFPRQPQRGPSAPVTTWSPSTAPGQKRRPHPGVRRLRHSQVFGGSEAPGEDGGVMAGSAELGQVGDLAAGDPCRLGQDVPGKAHGEATGGSGHSQTGGGALAREFWVDT